MAPIENTGSPTNPDEEKVVADRIKRGVEDAKKYEAQKAANEAAKEATKGEGQKAVTKRIQEAQGKPAKNNTKKHKRVEAAEGEAPATPKNNTKKKPNAGLARVAAAEGKAPATPNKKNITKKKPNAGLARVAVAEKKVGFK